MVKANCKTMLNSVSIENAQRVWSLIKFINVFSMRNFKARLKKLEAKKPPVKQIIRIYWADGTFVGEMRY